MAPARAKLAAAEAVRVREPHRRVRADGKWMEPLHRAAARVVVHVLLHVERGARSAHLHVVPVGLELDRSGFDVHDLVDQVIRRRLHEGKNLWLVVGIHNRASFG